MNFNIKNIIINFNKKNILNIIKILFTIKKNIIIYNKKKYYF